MDTAESSDDQHIVFADLHIHGKYSRATSTAMEIPVIVRYARVKGLTILGTGDFTHPAWMRELKSTLKEVSGTGLYVAEDEGAIRFMATTEVCTVFEYGGETKKIHHLILCPSLEVAEQLADRLARFGDLSADGRPTLNLSAPELVEIVMEVSKKSAVIPAHIWTPWFSLFGSVNGFDRIEDCYQEETHHIEALETGLSSNPPMNWRLSALDRFTLVSNSDAHSPYPYRLGREANVMRLSNLTYSEILDVIRRKDGRRFLLTVETDPAYGKYHWTGHRRCGVSVSPSESRRLRGVCPICRRPMTKGVEERVESLADRPQGYRSEGAIGFKNLLPLQEIIASVKGLDEGAAEVWRIYSNLIQRFGNEYEVLLKASKDKLEAAVDIHVAEAIISVRNDDVRVVPGYDGVYGRIEFKSTDDSEGEIGRGLPPKGQRGLLDYMT